MTHYVGLDVSQKMHTDTNRGNTLLLFAYRLYALDAETGKQLWMFCTYANRANPVMSKRTRSAWPLAVVFA